MLKTSSSISLCSLLVTFPLLGFAETCPTTGIPVVVAHDGEVVATFHQSNPQAAFSDDLFLASPFGTYASTPIFNNKTSPVGSKLSLGTFTAGTELVFRIHTHDPNGVIPDHDYFTGDASRNHDGKPHARISTLPSSETLVEFEDYPEVPECPKGSAGAYTDLSFSFSNVKFDLPVELPPDSFLSYKARPAPAGRVPLSLTDAIGNGGAFTAIVTKDASLANPAKVPAKTIYSPEVSLAGYSLIKAPKRKGRVNVSNELGNWTLVTLKADRLLLPTSVDLASPPTAPLLENQGIVDAFTCYKTRKVQGKNKVNATLQIQDKLNGAGREYKIKQPTRLCAPADVGSGIKHADTYLMCYAVKPTAGKPQRKPGILVNNDRFGADQVSVKKEQEYCVPSTVSR